MSRETPLVSKTLSLVSFAIIIVIVALVLSGAYSGYEEYSALTGAVNPASSSTQSSQSQLSANINGSKLTISGLNVPNRMTYPLGLALIGSITISNVSVGEFDSGSTIIQPGESKNLSASVDLNFSKLLDNSKLFESALFNSTLLSINTTISANMVPLIGINLTRSANSTMGPVFDHLSTTLVTANSTISQNGDLVSIPMTITWINQSPVVLTNLWLNTTLVDIPGKPLGNYGSSSGSLSIVPGPNSETYLLKLSSSVLNGQHSLVQGTYTLQLSISRSSETTSLARENQTVSI